MADWRLACLFCGPVHTRSSTARHPPACSPVATAASGVAEEFAEGGVLSPTSRTSTAGCAPLTMAGRAAGAAGAGGPFAGPAGPAGLPLVPPSLDDACTWSTSAAAISSREIWRKSGCAGAGAAPDAGGPLGLARHCPIANRSRAQRCRRHARMASPLGGTTVRPVHRPSERDRALGREAGLP
jgi:hypothetical protein